MNNMQTRRERVRQAAIDEIKSLAWDIANDNGLEEVTINAITKRMGMTPPAFYSYFKSRDALMKSLVFDAYKSYQQALEVARDGIPEENIAERIMAIFLAYRQWSITHPVSFGLFAGRLVAGFNPPEEEIVIKAETIYMIFHSIFQDAWQKGVLKMPDDVLELPKPYKSLLKKFTNTLATNGPAGLSHIIIHIALLAHGTISMEISGRYNHLIDFSQLYSYQIIHELKKIGMNPKLNKTK
jgi:AcrR family transcriptional regulator